MMIQFPAGLLDDHPHTYRDSDTLPLNEWEDLGRPYVWNVVEEKEVKGVLYKVWYDYGYGVLVVTKGEGNEYSCFTRKGETLLVCEGVLVVRNLDKWIWV